MSENTPTTAPVTDTPVVPALADVQSNCVPQKKFERNEFGLICDGSVTYVYNEDGTINWRKMIKPEFLVPHRQYFEKRGLPIPETIDGLDDSQILILLGGIKELAQTRGYLSVNYVLTAPNKDYVASVCQIAWLPNYETHNQIIVFSSQADAHEGNTTSFGRNFLAAIAENRAFCRAVRNFLKVHIVSQEEIGGVSEAPQDDVATTLLRETMAKYGLLFDKVKEKLIEEKLEGAEKFRGIEDIPRFKQFELIERIKKKAAAAAAAAEATSK
jgi:hypothetical protein